MKASRWFHWRVKMFTALYSPIILTIMVLILLFLNTIKHWKTQMQMQTQNCERCQNNAIPEIPEIQKVLKLVCWKWVPGIFRLSCKLSRFQPDLVSSRLSPPSPRVSKKIKRLVNLGHSTVHHSSALHNCYITVYYKYYVNYIMLHNCLL